MTPAAVLQRYLCHVLRLAEVHDTHIDAPAGPDPLAAHSLLIALNDPAVLLAGTTVDDPQHRMSRLVRLALWLDDPPKRGIPPDLASRAARYRFLVWSLPSRLPEPLVTQLRPEVVGWHTQAGPTLVEFSRSDYRQRARTAREDWLWHLSAAEDDPWLATRQAVGDPRLEEDLRWLTTAWPPSTPRGRLDLTEPDAGARAARADHRRVAAEVAEAHWLPRAAALAAVTSFAPRHPRWAVAAFAGFPLACAALVAAQLAGSHDARWLALAILAAATLTVTFIVPARADVLALLRIPAAAAAGDALLLSLTPRWWLAPTGWAVGAALLIAVWCYITLEARLHGTPRPLAAARATLVWVVGALYAFTLAVVFLGFVAPAMGEHGRCLNGWWTQSPLAPLPLPDDFCQSEFGQVTAAWPAGILLLVTGWSLAVGVAAQVLWEDRPLTAPLGGLRRVRGTR